MLSPEPGPHGSAVAAFSLEGLAFSASSLGPSTATEMQNAPLWRLLALGKLFV